MSTVLASRELVLGISPFVEPAAALVAAVERGGGLGVLDLGRDATAARAALADTERWAPGRFGVRVPIGCATDPAALPDRVDTVVLGPGVAFAPDTAWTIPAAAADGARRVLVEVVDLAQARAAAAGGAFGLIARGAESGGP
ncbi:MAG: hypothetical protein ACQSGP_23020, partial [Frankia sp.]